MMSFQRADGNPDEGLYEFHDNKKMMRRNRIRKDKMHDAEIIYQPVITCVLNCIHVRMHSL